MQGKIYIQNQITEDALGGSLVKKLAFVFAIAIVGVIAQISTASAPSFTVLTGNGTLSRNNQRYPIGIGSKMVEGDAVETSKQLRFLGDYGAFVATATGRIEMILLRREKGCIRNVIGYKGTLRIVPRPFNCATSLLQVQSLATGGSYTYRGTDTVLKDVGDQSLLAVNSGKVVTQNQGVTVVVNAGYGNIIKKDKPPSQPIKLDSGLSATANKIERLPWGFRLHFQKSPLSTIAVYATAQGVDTKDLGNKAISEIKYPVLGNGIKIKVTGVDGQSRSTYLDPINRK